MSVRVSIYASDLDKSKLTDAFMGKGFEAKLKKVRDNGNDLIIGEFYDESEQEEY